MLDKYRMSLYSTRHVVTARASYSLYLGHSHTRREGPLTASGRAVKTRLRKQCARVNSPSGDQQPLNSFFDSAPAVLVILDKDLRVLRANETMAEIIGISPKEIVGQPIFGIPRTKDIGFFALHNKAGGFDQEDLHTAEGLSKVASIALQNSLLYEKIREAESELHRLSAQLLVSQDQERRRIARVLHEETAQVRIPTKLSAVSD